MDTDTLVQNGKPVAGNPFEKMLEQIYVRGGFDTFGVAVAYASVAGLNTVLNILRDANTVKKTYWLFGLDDCLTHPSVLERVTAIPGSELRVAGERIDGRRFHPKVYWLSSSAKKSSSALIVGSANLTINGLKRNVESAVSMSADNQKESAYFASTWKSLWSIGTVPSDKFLEKYRADFLLRPPPHYEDGENSPPAILDRDSATVDPSCATVCWIEVGKITGFQSEQLEIKAEQALFFGLTRHGADALYVNVRLRSGRVVPIPAKYGGNSMWRFYFPQSIPEVAKGLRPGGGRSPYAAVFKRIRDGEVSLSFIPVASKTFEVLCRKSKLAGTLGHTTARKYGWF